MPAVLPAVLDRIQALLEGEDVPWGCAPGRYSVRPFELRALLDSLAAPPGPGRPQHVWLADEGLWYPLELPADLSGNYQYDGRTVVVTVAYRPGWWEATSRTAQILGDYWEIRRCLTDPRNWTTVAGWCDCRVLGHSVDEDVLVDERAGREVDVLYSRIRLGILVREDMTC